MTKYGMSHLFGYVREVFDNIANISEIQGLNMTGQIGVVYTFVVFKTNKPDEPCAYVSIFLVLISIIFYTMLYLSLGFKY